MEGKIIGSLPITQWLGVDGKFQNDSAEKTSSIGHIRTYFRVARLEKTTRYRSKKKCKTIMDHYSSKTWTELFPAKK